MENFDELPFMIGASPTLARVLKIKARVNMYIDKSDKTKVNDRAKSLR